MRFSLPRIYPITDTALSGLRNSEQVRQFAEAGAELIQIREKGVSSRELYAEVGASLEIARALGVKIIVNDRVDIALAANADGVHLGQDDLPPAYARKLLGPEAIIGYSTHSVEQAVEALNSEIDYIAIGPIFETRTKKDPEPVVGVDGLSRVRQAVGRFPLVAIGGITDANFAKVLAAGADSVALISTLYSGKSAIDERYRQLLGLLPNVKHF